MSKLKEFFAYGEKVPGYEVRVLNEREARAAAGILFVGAFLGLVNGVMLGTAKFSEYFVTFFAIDFTIRIIQPRYSPSLLLGRFFVRNQKPEYVGAAQKRFAWALGMILAWPMFYYLVIDFQPNPLKVLVCLICMALLFFEAAFSICLGCKIFSWIKRKDPKYCPGGVCELQTKDPVQKFTPVQSIILLITVALMLYGIYAYFTKLPDRTVFVKKMKTLFMTQEQLDKLEEQKMDEEFENDDW
jgi:fumarate reductase subunit C